MSLIDKHGEVIPHGSIIRWYVQDNDDFVQWDMTGMVVDRTQHAKPFYSEDQYVVYLGGGCDFGGGIGNKETFKGVMESAEANDEDVRGIEVIGTASQMARWIRGFGG